MTAALEALAAIRSFAPRAAPKVAIVLGSGLGPLADRVLDAVTIPYPRLPGWPAVGVAGHGGELVLGHLAGVEVAVMRGRGHYYEHGRADVMRVAIATLGALGVQTLLLTNAAGSLRADAPPGSVMLITDHIAWSGMNPLIGDPSPERFVDLSRAYDPAVAQILRVSARRAGVAMAEGVYMWFSGPSFETPAEIRMAQRLGADAVGMSTVPEVILARRFGIRVGVLSAITNMGAGLSDETLSHEHTQAQAVKARDALTAVIEGSLGALS